MGAVTRALLLSTESRLENVALVGAAVTGVCDALGLPGEVRAEVELCVVEAVNNAIEHAYRGEAGHVVEVSIAADAARLVIEVSDRGEPMPAGRLEAARAALALPEDPEPPSLESLVDGGRGLAILLGAMDEVRYERAGGRNVLTMVRRIGG